MNDDDYTYARADREITELTPEKHGAKGVENDIKSNET